jgi:hypothetical protein
MCWKPREGSPLRNIPPVKEWTLCLNGKKPAAHPNYVNCFDELNIIIVLMLRYISKIQNYTYGGSQARIEFYDNFSNLNCSVFS